MSLSVPASTRSTSSRKSRPSRGARLYPCIMKRIAAGGHMQPRQSPPRAADRVEAASVQLAKLRRPRERFAHDALGFLKRPSRQVLQGKAAKLEGHALPDLCADNIDELQAAAAEIADHAVRTMKS